jgi:hypothetical protein
MFHQLWRDFIQSGVACQLGKATQADQSIRRDGRAIEIAIVARNDLAGWR